MIAWLDLGSTARPVGLGIIGRCSIYWQQHLETCNSTGSSNTICVIDSNSGMQTWGLAGSGRNRNTNTACLEQLLTTVFPHDEAATCTFGRCHHGWTKHVA